ncbi:MAG TPA: VWA domain-containing protein [Blastocatellia bacterium]|jgi:Ca-activated chloride channel homolog|nr:VWA domain-containing protein [Blastocatellia bacterium]
MSNRIIFRVFSLASIITLLSLSAIREAGAQDPPRPPEPKPAPQREDAKARKGDKRQGAQADEQIVDKQSVIEIKTDLVQLDVTVIDQNGLAIMDLQKDDFTVYEDKVKQKIENVSREEVPVSFGMVIDTSGSMKTKLQTVSDAAVSLVKQMRADDEAFLASFNTESELVQDFTNDRRELEDAIGQLYTLGGTALLDAIIATSEYANDKGKQRRKALVVISDGLEKNSSVKEKEVMEAIKEYEVQVYLVGFVDEDEEKSLFGKSPAKKAKDLLSRLAEDSGGKAYFPKDVSEIPAIAAQIAKDLRTQYVVTYTPSNENRDGTFRTVQVNVNQGSRKLIARTRRGYYARDEKGQLPTAAQKKARGN